MDPADVPAIGGDDAAPAADHPSVATISTTMSTDPAQVMLAAAESLIVPGEVGSTRLQLRDGLSLAEWRAVGGRLRELKNRMLWWVGDWCAYGECHYGATYTAALAETGYDYQTVANASHVARRFEFYRRRENLSWSHHAEVASLEPAEADRWLDRAMAEHWSQKTLRAAIKAERSRLEGDIAVAAITERPSIESEVEPPELESAETEEPNGDQEAEETAGVGDDGSAARDRWRVWVEGLIEILQYIADDLSDLNIALLARQPDVAQWLEPLWFEPVEDAMTILNRFCDALDRAIGGGAAGSHDASPHPEEHHHGDQQDAAGRVPLKEVVP
jgi:hypothetical protein